jgi:hypothetical protein
MKTIHSSTLCLGATLALALPAAAQTRTSANYTIVTEAKDIGGRRATSASYTNDGSAGGIAGVSTVAAPPESAKHGYIAQLYEVTGLTLTAASLTVNETATDQLDARFALDDATFTAIPATSVAWSVLSGPITGISTGGLATAGNVYQDTAATVQGISAGRTGSLGLTVLNVTFDDFGLYAGDGIADDWQVLYFGVNNANAGPLLDPDHDGWINLFEYNAGIVPTDPLSVFHLRMEPVAGQPGQRRIIFRPRLPGHTYLVMTSNAMQPGTWQPLSGATVSDNGDERTVTDPNATSPRKLYRLDVQKP